MTYRERREAKADRLREWADKREHKAGELEARNAPYRGDIAFNTQPGHIPERARVIRRSEKAYEHANKAREMRRRADGIEAAADRAIYSDDPDAIDALRARIGELEAERDRWKAYNAACRKAGRCTADALACLDDKQRAEMVSLARVAAFQIRANGAAPAYLSSNLSGNINRNRKRLEMLEREAGNDDDQ